MNFYLDSSALVKLYIDEVGSDRIFVRLFAKTEVTDSVVSLAIELTKRRALRGYDATPIETGIKHFVEWYKIYGK